MTRSDDALAGLPVYLVGSLVFLVVAVRRGAPLIAVGSGLFVLGTLLYLLPEAQRARQARRGRRSSWLFRRADRSGH